MKSWIDDNMLRIWWNENVNGDDGKQGKKTKCGTKNPRNKQINIQRRKEKPTDIANDDHSAHSIE